MNSLIFRRMKLVDHLETCVRFRLDSYIASFPGSEDWQSHWDEQAYRAALTVHASRFPDGLWHVWQGDEIVGQLEFAYFSEAAHVNLYYLTEQMRGRGYGDALHTHVLSVLYEKGCSTATLRVAPENVRARKYYERLGWKDAGVDPIHTYVHLYKLEVQS